MKLYTREYVTYDQNMPAFSFDPIPDGHQVVEVLNKRPQGKGSKLTLLISAPDDYFSEQVKRQEHSEPLTKDLSVTLPWGYLQAVTPDFANKMADLESKLANENNTVAFPFLDDENVTITVTRQRR